MTRKSIGGSYPPDWKEIANRVKTEAGWRCIRCKHPHGDRFTKTPPPPPGWEIGPSYNPINYFFVPCDGLCTHPKDGSLRMLTVHHLDMNPENCEWWNLAALCQVCHLQIQAKVIMERVWMFEHSEWFRPLVAGYYAFQAGQPHDRESVLARIDELIAMGQGVETT